MYGRRVRAGRLVTMLMLLQTRGQMTATQLADELEVSRRTVLRDIEALSGAGVPVYSVRGAQGGFVLLDHFRRDLPVPERSRRTRAHLRLTPQGRQLAMLLGRPAGLRIRRTAPDGWLEASVIVESTPSAVSNLLALGTEVEVVRPLVLREAVAEAALGISAIYACDQSEVRNDQISGNSTTSSIARR
jgi:predicted DNA-binding transcriptional regulator YafY